MTLTAFSDGESLGVTTTAVSSAIALFSVSQLYKPVQASLRGDRRSAETGTSGNRR